MLFNAAFQGRGRLQTHVMQRLSWSIFKRQLLRQTWLWNIASYGFMMSEVPKLTMKVKQSRNLCNEGLDFEYEEAIKALNGLQSNAAVLQEIRKQRKNVPSQNLEKVSKYLERVGISMTELDRLPVIHVAGTKGKGSTCAFVEVILREHGLRTGFYSSPHLVAVRERIRLNGVPISKEDFSHYFWDVFNLLNEKKDDPTDLPAYFKFLTVLSLKIFLKEEVDVAILEVGIGGEYDCTNVVRSPVVCGITSLDLDHTPILGETIDLIAWHKGGIIKPNVPVFTVGQQPPEAMQVLRERAIEKQAPLYIAPPLEKYGWSNRPIHLGLSGYVQFTNASLALQLSHYFLKKQNAKLGKNDVISEDVCGEPFLLSDEDVLALKNIVWPGRSQILVRNQATFFIDGAHTRSSIQNCIDWFIKVSSSHCDKESGNVCKVLFFNLTGDRDHEMILTHLFCCSFDILIFTTNLATKEKILSSDQTNFTVSDALQIARTQKYRQFWIDNAMKSEISNSASTTESREVGVASSCFAFECIIDALIWLSHANGSFVEGEMSKEYNYMHPKKLREATHLQVLVTGSLHLVGGILGILDPSLSQDSKQKDPSSVVDFVKENFATSQYSTPGAP